MGSESITINFGQTRIRRLVEKQKQIAKHFENSTQTPEKKWGLLTNFSVIGIKL